MFEFLLKFPAEVWRQGELRLLAAPRIEILLLIAGAVSFAVWWMYRRETTLESRARRVTLASLRGAGILLIAVALMNPVLSMKKREQGSGVVAVGIDVSESMSFGSADAKSTRFERARNALAGKGGVLELLAGAGDVRVFAFGNGARQVQPAEVSKLLPADENSLLSASMKEMAQSSRGMPLDALVLLTDGAETGNGDPAAVARNIAGRGAVVHTVGFGEKSGAPDVEILAVRAPKKAQNGTVVDVSVLVRRGGVTGPLDMWLSQELVHLKHADVPPAQAGEIVTVRMGFIPQKEGTSTFVVEIPPAKGEQSIENNKRTFQLDVEDPRVEVLFVEGSPRHEYAFVRRDMADDPQFKVVSLLRLGKGRFYYGGDSSLLSDGFPETAEELGRFKAVILSDVEASFFSQKQLELMADFVKVRGGGLLMLGGVNSFNLGNYAGTPIADVLPVALDGEEVASGFDDTKYQFQISKEGAEHEVLRLGADAAATTSQWALMPPLKGFNPLYRAKAGARVLASHPSAEKNGARAVLFAVQDVGAGRTAAFAAANSWRWRMLAKSDNDTYRRFWSQMIRWLAVGSKELLSVTTDSDLVSVRQPLTLTARVLDKTHRAFNGAKVSAKVKDPFGNVDELQLPWILSEDGAYQAQYRPASKGDYTVSVHADVAGTPLEKTAVFSALETSPEYARPAMDAAALERIAKAGNGTVNLNGSADDAVAAILEQISKRSKLLELVEDRELRDAPLLLLLIAGVWIAEWVLRRRSGLA